ncbi:MAG: D-alanine--D-alanine ligase [Armatimonadetes bacterium]|nr:D-alanine--D-alanine ligase [Armatimonadota bacterium]
MTIDLRNKRVAVLLGGRSGEREVSLRSGAGVLAALAARGYDAVGVDPNCSLPQQLADAGAELVFNALHGGAGEDGTIPGMLEVLGIPYAGCGVLASALTLDKVRSKQLLQAVGIPTPEFVFTDDAADAERVAEEAMQQLGVPCVVKPVHEGSSLGVTIPQSAEELRRDVADVLARYGNVLVEAFCDGNEITVGVLGYDESLRALPVLELVPRKQFYDYEAKYTKGLTDLICPARIPEEAARLAQETAVRAHRACDCHGLSRVDMHHDSGGRLWVHEINSVPGLTETSDVPAEARAAGMSYEDLVEEILASAVPRLRSPS